MISKTYITQTVREITGAYKGFDRSLQSTKYIGMVMVEGSPDFWALDDLDRAVKELQRYYADNGYGVRKVTTFVRN